MSRVLVHCVVRVEVNEPTVNCGLSYLEWTLLSSRALSYSLADTTSHWCHHPSYCFDAGGATLQPSSPDRMSTPRGAPWPHLLHAEHWHKLSARKQGWPLGSRDVRTPEEGRPMTKRSPGVSPSGDRGRFDCLWPCGNICSGRFVLRSPICATSI